MKHRLIFLLLVSMAASAQVQAQPRQTVLINNNWVFSLGKAFSPSDDFGHGTEYFSYITKIGSNSENKGPASRNFDDSSWQNISLPHDWVVDLPYSGEASHSHGYKCVGWKYPENSVGWYRYKFSVPQSDRGSHIELRFDGIFRDSQVFCNGVYLGGKRSGYATAVYDLTPYLDYGGQNVISVRADASLEEGWFYEGAGIYRNVWMIKTSPLHVPQCGTAVSSTVNGSAATLQISCKVKNSGREVMDFQVKHVLVDKGGREVSASAVSAGSVRPQQTESIEQSLAVFSPVLWSLDNPYMYQLKTVITTEGIVCDEYVTPVGIRTIEFDPSRGFLLNGEVVKIKGVNIHQDHAGVGVGIPDALWHYRLEQLKSIGCNAVRTSHNPIAPSMLDMCDHMGILVVEENRPLGVNEEQLSQLSEMVERDYNHPSIIAWSIGNEEWYVESNPKGGEIARTVTDYLHLMDHSRPALYADSGGNAMVGATDVAGFNYLAQNNIDAIHKVNPQLPVIGTEETTGTGTRGKYATRKENGWMEALNRSGVGRDLRNFSDSWMEQAPSDQVYNVIERGWRFCNERPWYAGVFFWTGFDYRGESNPMVWPATGSQFGILDYCGFLKDEAYYLKSWWTDETVLHLLPHWNLSGKEYQNILLWAYTNCDEVQLTVNGKNLGRKRTPRDGHISWNAQYKPGNVIAVGYKNGKKVATSKMSTAGNPAYLSIKTSKKTIKSDGQDVIVADIQLFDIDDKPVTETDLDLRVYIDSDLVRAYGIWPLKKHETFRFDPVTILGFGNGDPGFKCKERPDDFGANEFAIRTFAGKAQVLFRSVEGCRGSVHVSIGGAHMFGDTIELKYE